MAESFNKKKIESFLERGKRFDGRNLLETRKIEVQENIVNKAEGSAKVKIGKTEVIGGVKLGLMEPYTDSPDAGTMMVGVELSPLSSPDFEPGPPNERAIEIARIVDRGIRESELINFKELCVKKGELVWCVFIDIYSLNDDGNLLDASALAAAFALKNAVFPKIKDDKVQYGELTTKKLPLKKDIPISLTFHKIGKEIILDPILDEEDSSDARLTIALTPSNIHALQKGGEEPFTLEEIEHILEIAEDKAKELKKELKL